MEIHLKINDVVGMDDDKRHILLIDNDELRRMFREPKVMENLVMQDRDFCNRVYLQEKNRREKKQAKYASIQAEKTKEKREQERRRAAFIKEGSVEYLHEILGWNKPESE